jgi:hypothetical protein
MVQTSFNLSGTGRPTPNAPKALGMGQRVTRPRTPHPAARQPPPQAQRMQGNALTERLAELAGPSIDEIAVS